VLVRAPVELPIVRGGPSRIGKTRHDKA
jgi:hypothetical protein